MESSQYDTIVFANGERTVIPGNRSDVVAATPPSVESDTDTQASTTTDPGFIAWASTEDI